MPDYGNMYTSTGGGKLDRPLSDPPGKDTDTAFVDKRFLSNPKARRNAIDYSTRTFREQKGMEDPRYQGIPTS